MECLIPAPVDRAFAFFSDITNLARITPPDLRLQMLTPVPVVMKVGTLIDFRVRVRGLDHEGKESEQEVADFTARIFQHEIDHTNGHVYLDRMPDLTTLGYTVVL